MRRVLLFLLCSVAVGSAATCTNTASASLALAASWNCGHAPLATDTVVAASGFTVTVTASATLASLRIQAGATVQSSCASACTLTTPVAPDTTLPASFANPGILSSDVSGAKVAMVLTASSLNLQNIKVFNLGVFSGGSQTYGINATTALTLNQVVFDGVCGLNVTTSTWSVSHVTFKRTPANCVPWWSHLGFGVGAGPKSADHVVFDAAPNIGTYDEVWSDSVFLAAYTESTFNSAGNGDWTHPYVLNGKTIVIAPFHDPACTQWSGNFSVNVGGATMDHAAIFADPATCFVNGVPTARAPTVTGTVTSSGSSTLTDSTKSGLWITNQWAANGGFGSPDSFVVITGGTGAGQVQTVIGNNTTGQLAVLYPWDTQPDTTSTYAMYAFPFDVGHGAANFHYTSGTAIPSGKTATFKYVIGQLIGAADNNGDFWHSITCPSGATAVPINSGVYTLDNTILLPSLSHDNSGTLLTSNNCYYKIRHSTYFTGAQSVGVNEGGLNQTAGAFQEFTGNISWAGTRTYSGGLGPWYMTDEQVGTTGVTDVVAANCFGGAASCADYNADFHALQTGRAATDRPGSNPAYNVKTSVVMGTHDKRNIDPGFANPWATPQSWAQSLGLDAGVKDPIQILPDIYAKWLALNDFAGADANFAPDKLWDYLAYSQTPANATLAHANSDGTDIGAMPVQACQITSARPRIYTTSTGYGGYATLKDRWLAEKAANTPEFQRLVAHATTFLTTDPGFAGYYESLALEDAFLYMLDPVTYANFGHRAMHFLALAQAAEAPGVFITAATNSNPVVFTAVGHGMVSNPNNYVTVWGGTGAWAPVNQGQWNNPTIIDADHFSIPVNSTAFGALTGTLTATPNNYLVNRDYGRWRSPDWAAAWDWAHDLLATDLTSNQKTLIQHAMEGAIQFHSTTFASDNVGGIANLVVGPMNGALQMAVALSGDASGMDTACLALRTRFTSVVPQAYTNGGTFNGFPVWPMGRGGAFVESSEYSAEVILYILDYLTAMQGATGEDLLPLFGGTSWLAAQAKGWSQLIAPSGIEMYSFGDITRPNQGANGLGEVSRQILGMIAYHATRLGDTTTAGYAQWWLTHTWTEAQSIAIGGAQGQGGLTPDFIPPQEALWFDPSLPAIDYSSAYGLDYFADGIGLVLSKSSAASTATWVGMKAGALRGFDEDHFHSDLLGFAIQRKGDWLTHELIGWGDNYSWAKLHNTVIPATNQFEYYWGPNARTRPENNGMTDTGKVTRYEANSSYTYAQGDATPAYRGNDNVFASPPYVATINTVIRDFFYLKPDIVVIADRLAYDSGNPTTVKWNLQLMQNPGTISGNTFTAGSAGGTQALNVAMVAPASPTFTVVSPATQATESGDSPFNQTPQWRVEVPQGSAQSHTYMAVLQAGDAGFTPATVTTLTATNANAAQFSGNVVAAPLSKVLALPISYTFDSSVAVQHYVLALATLTPYHVTISGGSVTIAAATGGGDTTTSAGGILQFPTGAGAPITGAGTRITGQATGIVK